MAELLVIEEAASTLALPAVLLGQRSSVAVGETARLLVHSGLEEQELLLEIYEKARGAAANVGLCIQSYLRRAAMDLDRLQSLEPGIRLVKGAYQEPASVAFRRKGDVDRAFARQADRLIDRSAEARALEPSIVIAIPYAPVRRLYEEHPVELWSVVKLLVGRLRAMDETLADSVFLDVTGRTAKRLLELAGEADEFTLPITQEELAGMVGASRERVNKAIASFVRLGWLDQSDRRYVITNREQLSIRAR